MVTAAPGPDASTRGQRSSPRTVAGTTSRSCSGPYSAGAMSQADLARKLDLTKVTVSDLVAELLESGHAVELGPSDEVRPGKPATLVDVNRTGRQIIGLDLGRAPAAPRPRARP